MSVEQLKALKSLKKREDIVILKADKGNATVVMKSEEYHQKCLALLQPPTYVPLSRDPTSKVERRIMDIIKDFKTKKYISKELFHKLKPSLSKAPHFYGLPKVHKAETPLRPIVSAIGSPAYNLAKFVASIISPLMGTTT